ncbi:UDP-N-acetylmuramoyl-L-alanyl-D-glutamate--2,6-diaminopimelate ligase [Patescibacteria group bacterium]|nr:UDP-N-acetylmuramoyl-L-alanyl-D-glutamate--2,6-diaminopimelate ligase [Patescibacteria group bacterium]
MNIVRKILSQRIINIFYHLPQAILANIVYGFPTRGLKVIGVTGTDGKTTTVNMIYRILKDAGKKVSMVSTINAVVAGKTYDTGFHITSPGRFLIQKFAKFAKEHSDEYLVLEVTSHALDQHRFWGIKFDVGVITNITHEHLDYHKTFENYFYTKSKLVKNVNFAIVNQNVKQKIQRSLGKLSKDRLVTFGTDLGDFNQKQIKLKLKVPGDYNIENALASLAVAFVLGIDKKTAQDALEKFAGIPGRMEEIQNDKGIKIIIDFAHTPNGLKQALNTLRSQASRKLISLIGCEGLRDVSKRSAMGEIARNFSDYVVVTAVDPRGQLDTINKQIIDGLKKGGGKEGINYFVVKDRQEAINFAINSLAKKGDTVSIFGKGHETSINLDGKKEIPWSDKDAVGRSLENNPLNDG